MSATPELILPTAPPTLFSNTLSTFVLNETTDKVEFCFCAATVDAITALMININAVSGTPTVRLSIQGRDSAGRADGVIKSSGNAKVEWTATAVASWQTLTSSYTPSRGERLAIVAELVSGTSVTINIRNGGASGMPFVQTYDNGTATLTKQTSFPVFGYKTANTVYGFPVKASVSQTFTASVEYGNEFTLPPYADSYSIIGVDLVIRPFTSATFDCLLYRGGAAGDTTVDKSRAGILAEHIVSQNSYTLVRMYFDTPSVFNAGDVFRLSVKANNANNVGLSYLDVINTEDFEAMNPWRRLAYSTTRNAGNWTDTNTRVFGVWPVFSDLTSNPSGGGLFRRVEL